MRGTALAIVSPRNAAGVPARDLGSLVESAAVGIAVIADAKLSYANRRFTEIAGDAQAEVEAALMRAIAAEERPLAPGSSRSHRGPGSSGEKVLSCRRRDGEIRWVRAVGSRIQWEGRPAAMFTLIDVTEQKDLEAQIEHAGRLNTIGRLVGGIVHDLGNILQVIEGSCALARERLEDRGEVRRAFEVVREACRRAGALTRQLRSFSRKDALQPRQIDLADLLRQEQQILSRILGDDIRLTVLPNGQPSVVRIDPSQMQQVVMNLVVNARDAMPEGGTITIALHNADREVEMWVTDSGIGMDEATLAQLFEPFFTTKQPGEGTGLGLSIVNGIVSQNGGNIQVHSSLGAGTRIVISLPRVEPAVSRQPAIVRPAPARGSGSVLLVEDEAAVRTVVRAMLERAGYRVTEAESGSRALEVFRASPDAFTLVLSDLIMPMMSGKEVASRIALMRPRVPVVFMTGCSDREVERTCGGCPVIHKPFEPPELLLAVGKAMGSPPDPRSS